MAPTSTALANSALCYFCQGALTPICAWLRPALPVRVASRKSTSSGSAEHGACAARPAVGTPRHRGEITVLKYQAFVGVVSPSWRGDPAVGRRDAGCRQADRSVGQGTDSRIAVRNASGSAVSFAAREIAGCGSPGREGFLMHSVIPETTRRGWRPPCDRGDMRCRRDAAGLWCTLASPVLAAPVSTGGGNFR